jgi:hypothetical protein
MVISVSITALLVQLMVKDGKTRLLVHHMNAVEPVWLFTRLEKLECYHDSSNNQKSPKVVKVIK